MTDIQIFKNEKFGEVRVTMNAQGEPMFCLADICVALGISNHRNVKARLDEDDVRLMDATDNLGRTQQVIYVTESGMYDAILRSDAENPTLDWLNIATQKAKLVHAPTRNSSKWLLNYFHPHSCYFP